MIITLEELNNAVEALPRVEDAVATGRHEWRVSIPPKWTLGALPILDAHTVPIRIATFQAKKVLHFGVPEWRWAPKDDVVI